MAVGVSPVVATTVLDFIDYAMFAVGVLIAYFAFQLVTYSTEEERTARDAARDELRGRVGSAVTGYRERRKAEEGVRERRGLLEPAKGFLIRAVQNSDSAREEFRVQSAAGLRRGRDYVENVERNLQSARRVIRSASVRARGERRDYLTQLAAAVESLRDRVRREVVPQIPGNYTVADWDARVNMINGILRDIEAQCGAIITSIDSFEDSDARSVPSITPGAGGGTGGAGSGGGRRRTRPSPGSP